MIRLVLGIVLVLLLFLILFDFSFLIKNNKRVAIFNSLTIFVVFCILYLIYKVTSFYFVINTILLGISLLGIVFGFTLGRKYIYGMALVLVPTLPILYVLDFEGIATFATGVLFLLLLLGVFRDVFYDKIFN